MLKSTSRTELSLLPHTHDAAPVKSKVAPQLTASQGIDYHSMARTVYFSHHREGHYCCMGHRMTVDTLYVVITAQVPLHMYNLTKPGTTVKEHVGGLNCPYWILKEFANLRPTCKILLEPFFAFADRSPVHPVQMRLTLRSMLNLAGFAPKLYDTHSLCAGRACDLHVLGFDLGTIKKLGHWRSNSVFTYLH